MKHIFPVLLTGLSLFTTWAGLTLLCFQSPNQRYRMGLPKLAFCQRYIFITASIMLLMASLGATITVDGPSFGGVLWLCQAGIVGVAITCLLPYKKI